MNPDDLEAKTIANYDANAHSWTTAHAVVNHWIWAVEKLKTLLPAGKVLEIGCGGGRDAAELLLAGYDYTGTDASQGMVSVAQTNVPAGVFKHLSVYDVETLNTKFDGFWACNVLLHIPKQRIGEALTALNHSLKQGAVGMIALKNGDGEDFEVRDIEDRHEERLFVYWRKGEFTDTLAQYGFHVTDYRHIPVDKRTSQHVFFVVKDAEA
jgi:SAM-dependent methyltransferase